MVSSNLRFLATSASCGSVCCRRSPGWCFAWLAVAVGIKACETICKHYSSCQRCVVAAVTEVPTGQLYAWRPPTAQICCLCWCVICVSHWPPLVGVCGSAAVTVQLAVLRVPVAYAAAALSCLALQSGQIRKTAELLTEKLPDSGCGAVWCCSSVCPGLVPITSGHRCAQQGASCALEFLCNFLVQGMLHFQSASLALSARPLAG